MSASRSSTMSRKVEEMKTRMRRESHTTGCGDGRTRVAGALARSACGLACLVGLPCSEPTDRLPVSRFQRFMCALPKARSAQRPFNPRDRMPNDDISGETAAERSGPVSPVRVHAHVGRLLFCYFINSRLKDMMTMPAMRPKMLSCPLP